MIGFGIWHFFVPRIWNWYSYIKPEATELFAAVRAVNFFFSLSLVLIGAANIISLFPAALCTYSHASAFLYTLGGTYSDAASLPSGQYKPCPSVWYACSFHNHLRLFCSFAGSDCVSCVKAFYSFSMLSMVTSSFNIYPTSSSLALSGRSSSKKQTSLIFS